MFTTPDLIRGDFNEQKACPERDSWVRCLPQSQKGVVKYTM